MFGYCCSKRGEVAGVEAVGVTQQPDRPGDRRRIDRAAGRRGGRGRTCTARAPIKGIAIATVPAHAQRLIADPSSMRLSLGGGLPPNLHDRANLGQRKVDCQRLTTGDRAGAGPTKRGRRSGPHPRSARRPPRRARRAGGPRCPRHRTRSRRRADGAAWETSLERAEARPRRAAARLASSGRTGRRPRRSARCRTARTTRDGTRGRRATPPPRHRTQPRRRSGRRGSGAARWRRDRGHAQGSGGATLERGSQPVDVTNVVGGQAHDERATPRLFVQQAFGAQELERLAYRAAADRELLGDLRLDQVLSLAEPAGQDLLADAVGGVLGERSRRGQRRQGCAFAHREA